MSVEKDPALEAITDARALLDTLLSSGWQELHLVSGNTEIFLARNGGGLNPMRACGPVTGDVPLPASTDDRPETVVKAPHVATLVDALPAGTAVIAGQKVATLRVLDESEAIEAPVSGTISGHGAAAGDLVDYGAPLVSIRVAA
ncbi:MAG: hypothetical protein AB7E24_04135 [Novosphingobium sp.]